MPLPPPALAELHELRNKLLEDYAAAEALILGAPDKRDKLLDQPGTDRAIRKLDADVETAHLTIERLDRIRPELDTRIAAATTETREAAWFEMRERLAAQVKATAALMAAAKQAFIVGCEMRLEAQRAGFVQETAALPYHVDYPRMDAPAMLGLVTYVRHSALHVPFPATKTWTVRFTSWTQMNAGTPQWTGYLEGQEAGFDAATAWALVDAGKAVFPDPKNRPPRPPKPKRKARTQVEQRALEEGARGGRRKRVELPPGEGSGAHETIGTGSAAT